MFFKVVVSGKPEPTLTWYHNEKELTPNYSQEIERDGSLSIPSTELKHGGIYRLVARNSAGSTEQEVKLSVVMEGENTPEVEHKSMDFIPIPVKDFGKYVAKNHDKNNQGFKEQFQVGSVLMKAKSLCCNTTSKGYHFTLELFNICRALRVVMTTQRLWDLILNSRNTTDLQTLQSVSIYSRLCLCMGVCMHAWVSVTTCMLCSQMITIE